MRKTKYEKLLPLIVCNPNHAFIKTAFRYIGDDAILREAQRRDLVSCENISNASDTEIEQEAKERYIFQQLREELERIYMCNDASQLRAFIDSYL